MPKSSVPEKNISIEMAYRGPVPPSGELKNYEAICPGAGKAIIENFLEESQHRRDIEQKDIKCQIDIANRTTRQYLLGLVFGFVSVLLVLGVGVGFMLQGYPVEGASIISIVIVGLAASFISGNQGTKQK